MTWRYEWSEKHKKFIVYEGDVERRHLASEKEAAAIVRKMIERTALGE